MLRMLIVLECAVENFASSLTLTTDAGDETATTADVESQCSPSDQETLVNRSYKTRSAKILF